MKPRTFSAEQQARINVVWEHFKKTLEWPSWKTLINEHPTEFEHLPSGYAGDVHMGKDVSLSFETILTIPEARQLLQRLPKLLRLGANRFIEHPTFEGDHPRVGINHEDFARVWTDRTQMILAYTLLDMSPIGLGGGRGSRIPEPGAYGPDSFEFGCSYSSLRYEHVQSLDEALEIASNSGGISVGAVPPEQHQLVMKAVLGYAVRHGDWPVGLPFAIEHRSIGYIPQLINDLAPPFIRSGFSSSNYYRICLNIWALPFIDPSGDLRSHLTRAITLIAQHWKKSSAPEDNVSISLAELSSDMGLSPLEAAPIALLLEREPWIGSGNFERHTDWRAGISREILDYRAVSSWNEYLGERAKRHPTPPLFRRPPPLKQEMHGEPERHNIPISDSSFASPDIYHQLTPPQDFASPQTISLFRKENNPAKAPDPSRHSNAPELVPPKVFVSYSWDNEEHKQWVLGLATRLRSNGVDVILDRWDLYPGEELSGFMEKSIRESRYVVIVCTPRYKSKADNRKGGVGYEGSVITGEVMAGTTRRKFIPILRHGPWPEAAPSWCASAFMIDLQKDPEDPQGFDELLRSLLEVRIGPPPLGTSPFLPKEILSSIGDISKSDPSPVSPPSEEAPHWAEIKRLISQGRPITRKEGLSRWTALASKYHPPSDVIDVVESIIANSETDDETTYALLQRLKASKTLESLGAIARLIRVLANGGFASRPKTGLNLSYFASENIDTREQLLGWLESERPEREMEPGFAALLRMSEAFPPGLEQHFDRIERICQKHPRNTHAQQTFRLLTGKDLPVDARAFLENTTDRAGNPPPAGARLAIREDDREIPLPDDMRGLLTPREAMIAQAILRNWSNEAIASEFHLSPGTVKIHIRNIFSKLKTDGRSDFIHQAARHLVLQLEDQKTGADPTPSKSTLPKEQGLRVTCITKDQATGGHEAITHVGGQGWKLPIADVINSIRSGTNIFYTLVGERMAKVVIVNGKNGPYLQAYADGACNDDLLELGECS